MTTDDDKDRMVYVSVDFAMGSEVVTEEVIARLNAHFLSDVYNQNNVIISATHTHAAPGGFSPYVILQVPTEGFVRDVFEAYVEGIVNAIVLAHLNIQSDVKIKVGKAPILDEVISINRSPTAYENNPKEEKEYYEKEGGNLDKIMSLFVLQAKTNDPLGLVALFPVHGTSLPSSNTLISSDNKGYASQLLEQTRSRGFVGAFGSTNLGDASPNVNGTFCQFSNKPCNGEHSTCGGDIEWCHGKGRARGEGKQACLCNRKKDLAKIRSNLPKRSARAK